MDCKQVEELIDAHALGALDEPERSQVEAHLRDCGDCRVQFEEASRVAQQLALAVPIETAPRDLFHRTMADIHRDIARSEGGEEKVTWFGAGWTRRLAPLSAAAASLVAVAALGFTFILNDRVDDIDDADGQNVRQQQLVNLALAADDRQQASLGAEDVDVAAEPMAEQRVAALYVWTPKHAVGVLIVSGLSEGESYRACYETAESGVRNGATLDAHEVGTAQAAFPIEKDDPLVAVGITTNDDCDAGDWLHHWEIDDPESCLPVLLTSGLLA
jgi:hypothetical protein